MRRQPVTLLFCGGLLLALLCGCGEQTPPGGIIEANAAYRSHFGEPPPVAEGRAYARVGFLPLHDASGQVRAVPLYLFTAEDQLRLVLERLTSDELLLPRESRLYRPFPADLAISLPAQADGVLTIDLATRQSWMTADLDAAARALTETAVQFPDVERVKILVNGNPLGQMPADGYRHDPRLVAKVPPPEFLLMAGVWDETTATLREILVEFDRPITVRKFQLYDAAGNKVAGEYFTSIFQMAVVVHPENPRRFRSGSILQAEWSVVDALGRASQGSDRMPLQKQTH